MFKIKLYIEKINYNIIFQIRKKLYINKYIKKINKLKL